MSGHVLKYKSTGLGEKAVFKMVRMYTQGDRPEHNRLREELESESYYHLGSRNLPKLPLISYHPYEMRIEAIERNPK